MTFDYDEDFPKFWESIKNFNEKLIKFEKSLNFDTPILTLNEGKIKLKEFYNGNPERELKFEILKNDQKILVCNSFAEFQKFLVTLSKVYEDGWCPNKSLFVKAGVLKLFEQCQKITTIFSCAKKITT